jgi:DNA-binding YbaB/EbfC family protein
MDMFKMMKQAAQMRKQMKKIQSELERYIVEGVCGPVKVEVSCDMAVRSVKIEPSAVDPARVDKLQTMLVTAINNALRNAKKQAGSEMSKMSGGIGGLSDMLGL